mgnify:CR=1 FL=1
MKHAVNWLKGLGSKVLYSRFITPSNSHSPDSPHMAYAESTQENPMRRPAVITLPVLLLALGLGACSSVPVETDYNPTTPFNTYQRYHWQTETSGSDSTISPFHAQRVRNELKQLLDSQLYREAGPKQKPDFLIRYYLSEHVEGYGRQNGSRGSIGLGGGSGGFGMGVSVGIPLGSKRPERNIQIIIDVLDGASGQLSWRGSALVDASHTPDEIAEDIVKAVQAIWKEYPPK